LLLLSSTRDELDLLAKGLLEFETLSGDEIKGLLNGKQPRRESVIEPSLLDSRPRRAAGSNRSSAPSQQMQELSAHMQRGPRPAYFAVSCCTANRECSSCQVHERLNKHGQRAGYDEHDPEPLPAPGPQLGGYGRYHRGSKDSRVVQESASYRARA
jgi:hypothetical protein